MIFALDIGNTAAKLYVEDNNRVSFVEKAEYCSYKSLKEAIEHICKKKEALLKSAPLVCSSVKPEADVFLTSISGLIFFTSFSQKLLSVDYKNPGSDRVAAAYGAAIEAAGRDIIVIDAGTAITVDIISKSNEYRGGVIIPGIEVSSRALSISTSLLTKSAPCSPQGKIAHKTSDALSHGLYYLYKGGLECVLADFISLCGDECAIYATGGASEQIAGLVDRYPLIHRHELLAQGLFAYYHRECQF